MKATKAHWLAAVSQTNEVAAQWLRHLVSDAEMEAQWDRESAVFQSWGGPRINPDAH